jgi:predicted RNA-binding Zn ribbon-like protein
VRPSVDRQPGGRNPATGNLAVVQSFVNTHEDLDDRLRERLEGPESLGGWLAAHGLLSPRTMLGDAELGRALLVREGLRAMLFANNGCVFDPTKIERMNLALRSAGVRVELRVADLPEFRAARSGLDGALAVLAMIVTVAQIDGTWMRLKACPGPHCGWAFYDDSRNQTGSWCSMAVCGSRIKARAYRRRRASQPSG